MKTTQVSFTVNGREYTMSVGSLFGQLLPNELLIDTLRERLGLTGSKIACKDGACGCCTVIIDGDAVPSCDVLTVDCEGRSILTIEGLAAPDGTLDVVQQAFVDYNAFQCGFCTPGIIMTTRALLDKNPHPTRAEAQEALAGNFCRCISHYHVLDAIESIA
ncbi:MAG: (2Fe-2S)-binding protein [Coriobacteriales bacterium]|jgi:carbon-monoxide dehydrogenase small subunit|nr:(2Fe-2S)-binding protein [Coriobacteriales bacterium]